ncbi:hypothetical protein GFM44_23420 [Rhizobium leguminosarum bv. viciae]|nr:hypothetical protein [Rhizobium leguminosarum bv. viciae]
MLRTILSAFGSRKPPEKAEDPETRIYSSIWNETSARGFQLRHEVYEHCKAKLEEALTSGHEPPMLQARRAYAGFQAVNAKYDELLRKEMTPWIEQRHGDEIRSLCVVAEVDDLLRQAVEEAHKRLRDELASTFTLRTDNVLKAELEWRLGNLDRLASHPYEPPPWATADEQAASIKAMKAADLLSGR